MAFGSFNSNNGHQQPLAEINMIPLIDVMLVLLIIFMVTAPLLTHAVKINLPQASNQTTEIKPQTITISLDAQGQVYWNDKKVSQSEWQALMQQAAQQAEQPELQIRADKELAYKNVVQIMSDAAKAGLSRIGFIIDPTTTH